MKVSEYKIVFERRYNKAKQYKMEVLDGVLAYRFLKSANLTENQQQLVKATLPAVTYENMTKKLSSMFLETGSATEDGLHLPVKIEPTYYVSNSWHNNRGKRGWGSNRGQRGNTSRRDVSGGSSTSSSSSRGNWPRRRKNPVINGEQTKCNICESVNHYQANCPDSYEAMQSETRDDNKKVTLYCKVPIKQTLVGEALGSVVLDSGCPKNVAGESWVQCYIETLCDSDLRDVRVMKSDATFQFGDGRHTLSKKKIILPTYIGGEKKLLANQRSCCCDHMYTV